MDLKNNNIPAKGVSRVLINHQKPLNLTQSESHMLTQHTKTQEPFIDPLAKQYQDHPEQSAKNTNESLLQSEDDENLQFDVESQLSEVYLCSCCGLTRELKPSFEYMPTIRVIYLIFNTLVFLFGLANFGMGLWFRIDPKVYEIHKYIETQNYSIAGWIQLFGGFIACVLSLVGCFSTYSQALVTLILLTIHGLGMSLELFLIKELYEQIRRRAMNSEANLFYNNDAAQFLDFVQVKMRCCGAVDFRDYQKLGMVIPTTCYTIAGNYINAPGCGRAIRKLFDIRAGMASGFTLGSVLSQLFAIVFGTIMLCSLYHHRAMPNRSIPSNRITIPKSLT